MSHAVGRYQFHDKPADYARLAQELAALLAGESDPLANAANTAALVFEALPEVNWAGFYFLKGAPLVVAPCQGRPACARSARGPGRGGWPRGARPLRSAAWSRSPCSRCAPCRRRR